MARCDEGYLCHVCGGEVAGSHAATTIGSASARPIHALRSIIHPLRDDLDPLYDVAFDDAIHKFVTAPDRLAKVATAKIAEIVA